VVRVLSRLTCPWRLTLSELLLAGQPLRCIVPVSLS
jgi:hypothetical protein